MSHACKFLGSEFAAWRIGFSLLTSSCSCLAGTAVSVSSCFLSHVFNDVGHLDYQSRGTKGKKKEKLRRK